MSSSEAAASPESDPLRATVPRGATGALTDAVTGPLPADAEASLFDSDIADDADDAVSLTMGAGSTVHDKYQFESTFDFDLQAEPGIQAKSHHVDVYFFVPRTMGINADTYSRDQFYSDLTNYLRLRTPERVQWDTLQEDRWQIPAAEAYLRDHLVSKQRRRLIGVVVQDVKLFGCLVNTQLKRLKALLYGKLRSGSVPAARLVSIEAHLGKLYRLVLRYRLHYMERIRHAPLLLDEEVKRAFLLVDEYVSYRLELSLINLRKLIDQHPCPGTARLAQLVDDLLRNEVEYRQRIHLGTIDASPQATETYYYRLGLLKKYVSEVLYLQVTNIKREKLYRNLIAAAGAFLAATWAAVTDFQRMQMIGRGGLASLEGARLVLIIFMAVIAYVFKDRIKELSKEYFTTRFKPYLPDFDVRMSYLYHDDRGHADRKELGASKEYVQYLAKGAIPAEVAYIRNLGQRTELDPDRNEVIIHYSRNVRFRLDEIRDTLGHFRFIKSVMRFDIHDFMAKLSDPQKQLSYFNADHGIVTIDAPKVYHVNVLFRYTVDRKMADGRRHQHHEYERVRLILDKKGIVRIETVVPRGELGYHEAAA